MPISQDKAPAREATFYVKMDHPPRFCGSWIGYTSYVYLLQHVPTSKVSTYAYVNPVVAVFLGWLILHERVDHYILLGSAIIIASVVLVTSAKLEKTSAHASDLPAVEAVGD